MQKNVVIAILSIALLVLVLMTIGYGCTFKIENFEDVAEADTDVEEEEPKKKSAPVKAASPAAEDKKAEPSALTPKEKEMFENIKNGSLTDEDIQKFIAEGKLTEKMVEKFLEHVDAPALSSTPAKATTPSPTKKPTVAVEEDFEVEGFSGSMYAKF